MTIYNIWKPFKQHG